MTGQRILVVDDNRIFQFLCKQIIEQIQPKAQITLADDGLEALAQCRAQSFDLIVTDYNIPGLDGLGFAEAVRQIAPDTQIILATLEDTADIRAEARRRQIDLDGFIYKPYLRTKLQVFFKPER